MHEWMVSWDTKKLLVLATNEPLVRSESLGHVRPWSRKGASSPTLVDGRSPRLLSTNYYSGSLGFHLYDRLPKYTMRICRQCSPRHKALPCKENTHFVTTELTIVTGLQYILQVTNILIMCESYTLLVIQSYRRLKAIVTSCTTNYGNLLKYLF